MNRKLLVGALLLAPLFASPVATVFGEEPDVSFQVAQGLSPHAALAAHEASRSPRIEVAQRLLRRLGLLNEPATGYLTQATSVAIRSFAAKNGLPSSDQPTPDLLRALRKSAWLAGGWATHTAKGQDKVLDSAGIKRAQALLAQLGYIPGPIDGTFGPQTQSSVESFETDLEVTVDGLITKTVLNNLERATQLSKQNSKGTLRILNWSDYIDPSILEDFQKQTKIRVIYDTFDSNEDLEAKLAQGDLKYDIAVPTASSIAHFVDRKLIQPLDKSRLKSLGNLDPEVMAYEDTWDPGDKYGVPYMWGTIGIADNPVAVKKLAPNAPVGSLKLIFDPVEVQKISSCGVRVLDSGTDMIPMVLAYLGLDPGSVDLKTIDKAEPVLMAVKKWVRPISSDDYIDALAQGKICVALAYSGDAIQARKSAKAPITIDYHIPSEGSTIWFDMLTIPANAPNPAAAHFFLEYLLQPQVIAKATNFVSYANANAKSGPFIDPAILEDPGIYPSPAEMKKLVAIPAITAAAQAEMQRIWTEFSAK